MKADTYTLATVPPDRISARLGLRLLGRRLTFDTRLTFVEGRRDVPATQFTQAAKAYGPVDLLASHQVNDRTRADIILQNVFDKRRTPYPGLIPSPGLTAKASLRVRLATRCPAVLRRQRSAVPRRV